MAQNTNIIHPMERYTRADYTALRAYMNRIPSSTILDLYYNEDDQERLGLRNGYDLLDRIGTMRDTLVARAIDLNPYLASTLQHARDRNFWTKSAVDALVQAADRDMFSPQPSHYLSLWFRDRVTSRLKQEGCRTITDLANLINSRGAGWYLPIPRIGHKVAKAIEHWFQAHHTLRDLVEESRLIPATPIGNVIVVDRYSQTPVPMEQLELVSDLDGHAGLNRSLNVCMIGARDDLDAVRAYLKKHEQWQRNDQTGQYVQVSKTYRSYKKEIERFILWCVLEQKKPMSSILGEDCEDYKRFIADPPSHWTGPRERRGTNRWKPFTGKMSPASQVYAIRALRYFFTYLVDVCYLSGNPWRAVSDPVADKEELPMQIGKALGADLWGKLSEVDGILDWYCSMTEVEIKSHFTPYGVYKEASMTAQMRLVRAAILLIGETGLRREEAARATRDSLLPIPNSKELWELKVRGKGRKKRTVLVPERVVEAIQAHWNDRPSTRFEYPMEALPLLSPVTLPRVEHAREKHLVESESVTEPTRLEQPFTADSLGRLVTKAMSRIAKDTKNPYLNPNERGRLLQAAAHALRHTFATNAVADNIPLDVVQKALGHASLQTTTIYTLAERNRMIEAFEKRQARRKASPEPSKDSQ